MRFLGLVCVLLSITAGASIALEDPDEVVTNYTSYNTKWEAFKNEYGRNYSEQEEQTRYQAFVENLKMIEAHNKDYLANKTSFFMGIGPFADRIDEDDPIDCDGLDDGDPDGRVGQQLGYFDCEAYTVTPYAPSSLDWRDYNAVTPVGYQGRCGSCYAFTATSHNGIAGTCEFKRSLAVAQVSRCRYSFGSETRLKYMVTNEGPVYISFQVLDSFRNYKGGIYNQTNCNQNNPSYRGRHAMAVIGYGSQSGKDYWIVKNSWGTGWGGSMRGFAYIERGVNMCGIADRAVVPGMGNKFNRGRAVLTGTEPDTYSLTSIATHPLATVSVLLLSCVLSHLNAN